MQISRHWRMNNQRYRLEGVRYENGSVQLQPRPVIIDDTRVQTNTQPVQVETRVPLAVGR